MNKMDVWLSKILDRISDYVSTHRGVPVLLGVLLVAAVPSRGVRR